MLYLNFVYKRTSPMYHFQCEKKNKKKKKIKRIDTCQEFFVTSLTFIILDTFLKQK